MCEETIFGSIVFAANKKIRRIVSISLFHTKNKSKNKKTNNKLKKNTQTKKWNGKIQKGKVSNSKTI